jgi:anaerobic magnesium-protoporphyrin IX monomethyl ester cyclase
MSDITIANVTRSYVERETPDTFVPLGPLYIVSVLEKRGYRVDFRDYLTRSASGVSDPTSPESIRAFLADSADILGISCVGSLLPAILLALERLKQAAPQKRVILGGIGASGVAEELLRAFPSVDIIVKGEGEATIVELADVLLKGGDLDMVEGISFRRGDEVKTNPPRPRIKSLNGLPFPAYHRLDFDDYSVIPLTTSRGCPFACTFCDVAPFWGQQNRKRSLANVMKEIELLVEGCGQRRIELVDDTFTVDRRRVLRFCQLLKERGWGLSWSCFARIDTMDEEMMAAMADSGCELTFYGLESGSDRLLTKIRKTFTRQQAEQVVAQSVNYFQVMASLIWGFPFETMADFYETVDLFRTVSRKTATTYLFSLNPFPLSELYIWHGDTIEFNREWGRRLGGLDKGEIVELVKQHPRVFPGFYHYGQTDFEEKYRILKDAGLTNTFMSCFELCSDAGAESSGARGEGP